MDTPGLGDTRGEQQDEINIRDILDCVAKSPDLNAIVVMINASDPRVKTPLLYAVSNLQSIIPDVVKENVVILLSNVNVQPNLTLSDLGLSIEDDRIFKIDNCTFSADPNDAGKL